MELDAVLSSSPFADPYPVSERHLEEAQISAVRWEGELDSLLTLFVRKYSFDWARASDALIAYAAHVIGEVDGRDVSEFGPITAEACRCQFSPASVLLAGLRYFRLTLNARRLRWALLDMREYERRQKIARECEFPNGRNLSCCAFAPRFFSCAAPNTPTPPVSVARGVLKSSGPSQDVVPTTGPTPKLFQANKSGLPSKTSLSGSSGNLSERSLSARLTERAAPVPAPVNVGAELAKAKVEVFPICAGGTSSESKSEDGNVLVGKDETKLQADKHCSDAAHEDSDDEEFSAGAAIKLSEFEQQVGRMICAFLSACPGWFPGWSTCGRGEPVTHCASQVIEEKLQRSDFTIFTHNLKKTCGASQAPHLPLNASHILPALSF